MGEQFTLDFETFGSSLIQLWTPDEIYDRLDHSNLRDFVEDRRIERKSSAIQAKALADYLSMWSNTQPHGGMVIVGISDKGSIAGRRTWRGQLAKRRFEAMTPKTAKVEKMTPEQQRASFETTARQLGCDESPDAFEAAVKKVARHKPVKEKPGAISEKQPC